MSSGSLFPVPVCVCTLVTRLCTHFLMLVAVGAYRSIERATVPGHPGQATTQGYKINQHPHKGLEMPGLFINTVGFVSFLWTWTVFVCLRPLCRICSNGTAVLTNSHVSSGHYQRCNHETAAMGKAVESLSTNFHTFLQMFQHYKNCNTFKITHCFFPYLLTVWNEKTNHSLENGSMESVKAKMKEEGRRCMY